ncbi:MAG: MotA/TolQ/ExbB proton channel family protein [Gammaproteobacteria bacterium]
MISLRLSKLAVVAIALLPFTAVEAAVSLGDLDRLSAEMRTREAKIWKDREAAQRVELQKQEKALIEATGRRNRAEARSRALDEEWNRNDASINEFKELLRQREGNLGELFGVTRQIAGDASNVLQNSMLSAQFRPAEGQEGRVEFMRRIAGAKELPDIVELERMWFELQREMTETARVSRFSAPVRSPDGAVAEAQVTRVGPFTATADGAYLRYNTDTLGFEKIARPLTPKHMAMARSLDSASGEGYTAAVVDPARGAMVGMFSERPSPVERIMHGEVVGYVIVAVGVLGVVLAIYQYLWLFVVRSKVNAQLRDLAKPKNDNPLGRVLLAMHDEATASQSVEVIELRISEAVLREVPKLQRFQGFLRLVVAAGPLLGLIGTVVGMIVTFHAITASGSSDPKLMAHGIGQAMIATVLGLGIAIPVLFINNGMTALSNVVTRILDEQSQAILAEEFSRRNPFLTRSLDEARRADKA